VRLVVTADDLGLSPAVTRGILEAHRAGVVRSASLLATYPGGEEAAALARTERDLEVGLHLDLVGGEPAAGAGAVPSLVGGDGRFHPLRAFALRLGTGRIRPSDLAREIRAQVRRVRGWGIEPCAWDSHRHTHLLPQVARVVGAVAREEGVRWVRRAAPPTMPRSPKAASLAAATAVASFFLRGIPGNDWFVDLTSARPALDAADVALLAAHGSVGELGAHPGHVDDALRARDSLAEARERDLALLTDPLLVSAIRDVVQPRVVSPRPAPPAGGVPL